ncbi:MAG: hypothetical protein BGO49_26330 [Planctomycetales bacterium 71-10]|nr:MAG: hypothetical protein BGO49_26330 [Planctomycetales bacterium 71-10]
MGDLRFHTAEETGRMARFRRSAAARGPMSEDSAGLRNMRAAVQPSLLAERRYRKAFYDLLFEGTAFASPAARRPDEAATPD